MSCVVSWPRVSTTLLCMIMPWSDNLRVDIPAALENREALWMDVLAHGGIRRHCGQVSLQPWSLCAWEPPSPTTSPELCCQFCKIVRTSFSGVQPPAKTIVR